MKNLCSGAIALAIATVFNLCIVVPMYRSKVQTHFRQEFGSHAGQKEVTEKINSAWPACKAAREEYEQWTEGRIVVGNPFTVQMRLNSVARACRQFHQTANLARQAGYQVPQ